MSNRIYIGRISSRTSERDIEKFFKGFGRIRFMSLKNGYGFVDLEDERDADDAVYELHGKELLGERVIVEHAKGPARRSSFGRSAPPPQRFPRGPRPTWLDKYGAPVRTGYKLIVENLSSRVSWQDLKDYMRQAGDVTFADAHKGEKNVGVVEFASYADMKKAKEKLDGTEINGRKIKLIEDVNNAPSRSRSRSRSRRRFTDRSESRDRSLSGRRNRRNERSESRYDERRCKRSYSRKSDDNRSRTRNDHGANTDKGSSRKESEGDERKGTEHTGDRSDSAKRKIHDDTRHYDSSEEESKNKSSRRNRSSSRESSPVKKRAKNRSYSRDSESDNE